LRKGGLLKGWSVGRESRPGSEGMRGSGRPGAWQPPDLMAALEESLCEAIHGHEWVDAGGDMQMCARCEAMREAPEEES
jgi:hypothetical protein